MVYRSSAFVLVEPKVCLWHGSSMNVYLLELFTTFCASNLGEVAKLFADAGLICIASLISPYRKDRDACRAMLTDANFIEVRLLLYGCHFGSFYLFYLR